jgi:hypothetical protein
MKNKTLLWVAIYGVVAYGAYSLFFSKKAYAKKIIANAKYTSSIDNLLSFDMGYLRAWSQADAKKSQDSREAVRESEKEKTRLQNSGIRPSFTKTQYQSWANAIQQAFEGCDFSGEITWGSDSPLGVASFWSSSGYKVASILNQLKNNLDYLELTTAWGIRSYDACGFWTGDIKDVDFPKAVQTELTAREINNLNQILTKKGISYKL